MLSNKSTVERTIFFFFLSVNKIWMEIKYTHTHANTKKRATNTNTNSNVKEKYILQIWKIKFKQKKHSNNKHSLCMCIRGVSWPKQNRQIRATSFDRMPSNEQNWTVAKVTNTKYKQAFCCMYVCPLVIYVFNREPLNTFLICTTFFSPSIFLLVATFFFFHLCFASLFFSTANTNYSRSLVVRLYLSVHFVCIKWEREHVAGVFLAYMYYVCDVLAIYLTNNSVNISSVAAF